jgi:hypothetical protein
MFDGDVGGYGLCNVDSALGKYSYVNSYGNWEGLKTESVNIYNRIVNCSQPENDPLLLESLFGLLFFIKNPQPTVIQGKWR